MPGTSKKGDVFIYQDDDKFQPVNRPNNFKLAERNEALMHLELMNIENRDESPYKDL